jgi:hypothetical protein
MRISIPENVGGELRVLPEDTYEASIQDLFYGLSQTKNPKITMKWVVQSEYSGKHDKDYQSTIGENVLESYSLQTKAVWKLNSLYKQITGEKLPMGDYEPEEFTSMIKEALVGAECMIDVAKNEEGTRSEIKQVVVKPKKKGRK